jgi:hypothetical protein
VGSAEFVDGWSGMALVGGADSPPCNC